MASTATYKCKNCGDPFTARTADRKRGWARFCSKSCKAGEQTRRTGVGASGRSERGWHEEALDAMEDGWDGHKIWSK